MTTPEEQISGGFSAIVNTLVSGFVSALRQLDRLTGRTPAETELLGLARFQLLLALGPALAVNSGTIQPSPPNLGVATPSIVVLRFTTQDNDTRYVVYDTLGRLVGVYPDSPTVLAAVGITPHEPTPTPTPTPTPAPSPPAPVAAFSVLSTQPLTVSFINASTDAVSFLWDFGDGSSSTLSDPVHTYAVDGVYTVRLGVTGPGGTDFVTHSVTPSLSDDAIVDLAMLQLETQLGAGGGAVLSANIQDTPAQLANLITTPRMVTLRYTTNLGGTFYSYHDSSGRFVGSVSDDPNALAQLGIIPHALPSPVAAFTFSVNDPFNPTLVNFVDQSSGQIDTHQWDFGDGIPDVGPTPQHQYTAAGTYTVTLTVTGPGGSDQATRSIVVSDLATVVDFSWTVDPGNPLGVIFTNLTSPPADSYSWDFGDGSPLEGTFSPIHTYLAEGSYVAILTATAGGVDSAPVEKIVTVNAPAPVPTPGGNGWFSPGGQMLAFPGAQGYGALSRGGRGGRVIEVTNLNDSGPGSLREAAEATDPRIVVFRVAGIIDLLTNLRIRFPYLTIAGQTAPGGGILLRGPSRQGIRIDGAAHDIIIRYVRLRPGIPYFGTGGADTLTIMAGQKMILDHVSMSWSSDENLGILNVNLGSIQDITIQRTLNAEGFEGHSAGALVSGGGATVEEKEQNYRRLLNVDFHNNLFMTNNVRNPRLTAANVKVVNNVVHNWGSIAGSTTGGISVDYINNYYSHGPMSNLRFEGTWVLRHQTFDPTTPTILHPEPSIYIAGNICTTRPEFLDPNNDNWGFLRDAYLTSFLPARFRRFTPLAAAPMPIAIQATVDARSSVLQDAGANARLDGMGRWVPNSDSLDLRLLAEATTGSGPLAPPIDPVQGGGWPILDPGIAYQDSDHDGIPDEWEIAHGLDPNNPTDAQTLDVNGVSMLDHFLNGTQPS